MINDILVFPRIYTNFRANVNQGVTKTNVSPLLAQTAALEQREIHRANNQKKKKKKKKERKTRASAWAKTYIPDHFDAFSEVCDLDLHHRSIPTESKL